MPTFEQALRGITMYPLPAAALESAAVRRGIILDDEATAAGLSSAAFRLVEADVLTWLSLAPTVAQGGQNYSFSDAQREAFRRRAAALYLLADAPGESGAVRYGYKGSRL